MHYFVDVLLPLPLPKAFTYVVEKTEFDFLSPGYRVGVPFGKNKLYPSVSPKKTVEGAVGGLVFGLLAAVLIAQIDPLLSLSQWLILATVVVITGNLGDLLESKFKRVAGVKDSGAILPGHGGMLDRLDSLIFAAPFAYLLIIIFN